MRALFFSPLPQGLFFVLPIWLDSSFSVPSEAGTLFFGPSNLMFPTLLPTSEPPRVERRAFGHRNAATSQCRCRSIRGGPERMDSFWLRRWRWLFQICACVSLGPTHLDRYFHAAPRPYFYVCERSDPAPTCKAMGGHMLVTSATLLLGWKTQWPMWDCDLTNAEKYWRFCRSNLRYIRKTRKNGKGTDEIFVCSNVY